jgi:predicted O-linked N-acetylglucosamine transferase (SPINDLY family)
MEGATRHHRAGRLGEAEALYRQVLARQPDHPDAMHLLGMLVLRTGRHNEAIELIRRAITLRPDAPEFHSNLASILLQAGRAGEAIAEFRASLAIQPDDPEVLTNLSSVLGQTGDLDQSIACARRAILLRPDLFAACNNLGAALQHKGEFDSAIAVYGRALAGGPTGPHAADLYHNLGMALHHTGRLDEAIDALRQASSLRPGRFESFNQLAVVLRERGRLDDAITAARQATTLAPASADAHNNLGIALWEKGQIDEAVAALRRAIDLAPDFGAAYDNLGSALADGGRIEEAVECYHQAARLDPRSSVVENLLHTLHFHPDYDAHVIAHEHAEWNSKFARPLAAQRAPHTNERSPDRRLRIGYVSPDLRQHPVGRFIMPLLANHDRERFEVFCYTDLTRPDPLTEKLKQNTNTWRVTCGLTDEALADLIRHDRIDILVDLAMHMNGTRMLAFARKPAPVQVTYLAYCSTTGLETMDYRFTDAFLDPPGMDESIYSEKSIRLKTYWCYDPPPIAPPVAPLPVPTGGHVTFGSFNNFGKVSRAALTTWMRVMAGVPGSHLILHAGEGSHRQRVLNQFGDAGIDPDRLHFFAKLPADQYLHQYDRIDIALDPFPYPGGTTTCDALWMGAPVVTLAGPTGASRGGVSILSNVGLRDLIADTPDHYVQIATELAANIPRLAELRSTMRDRMKRSALMDAPGFARDVEQAYREMWRTWCKSGV